MIKRPFKLLLASTSPRRQELLVQAGIPFELVAPGASGVDETPLSKETPEDYVLRLAIAKARAGWAEARALERDFDAVLGADTTVTVDKTLLEKPKDDEDAERMLRLLSGRRHRVLTALCLKTALEELPALQVSEVCFKALSDRDINEFIASREPFGKAGGYAIQGRAACFIEDLRGSYSGVMGLPLFELTLLLERANRLDE